MDSSSDCGHNHTFQYASLNVFELKATVRGYIRWLLSLEKCSTITQMGMTNNRIK